VNKKMRQCAFVVILAGLALGGCSSPPPTPAPAPSPTSSPTSTAAPAPTFTPASECILFRPTSDDLYSPRAADRPGWCEVEYSDFTISYPVEWDLDPVGAWSQNLALYQPEGARLPPYIHIISSTTVLTVDQVDQTILVYADGEAVFHLPVVDPEETVLDRNLRTIGEAQVLVLTTRSGERAIRRYFWVNEQPYWLDKRSFVFFEFELPVADLETQASQAALQTLEEMVSMVRLTPTCADGFTRLHGNMYAQVTAGGPPNRVRSGPGTDYEIESQVYSGTILSVRRGPVCADGLVFWFVNNQSIPDWGGWTAEGDFTEYYLEPYDP